MKLLKITNKKAYFKDKKTDSYLLISEINKESLIGLIDLAINSKNPEIDPISEITNDLLEVNYTYVILIYII